MNKPVDKYVNIYRTSVEIYVKGVNPLRKMTSDVDNKRTLWK